jgi:hypothetical protein
MKGIMMVSKSVGPETHVGLFHTTKAETIDPTLGWFFHLDGNP